MGNGDHGVLCPSKMLSPSLGGVRQDVWAQCCHTRTSFRREVLTFM